MKPKNLKKKIQRLEKRLQEVPKKLAKLKQRLQATEAAKAAKAKKKAAAKSRKAVGAKKTEADKKPKKKLNLSPERRAQLAAAMKARWAAKRAAEANAKGASGDNQHAAPLQIATHRVGFSRARGNVGHASPAILDRFAADETPEVSVESPEFFAHSEEPLRVLDGGRNLQSVPHNPGVAKQPPHIARAVTCDFLRTKSIERLPVVGSFL